MPSPASVLIVSRDPQLLNTRSLILRGAGYKTYPALSLADMHQWLSEPRMDVILLCHTLTTEECDKAVLLTHDRWPAAQVVALLAGQSGCVDLADATVEASDGPAKLINTLKHQIN